MEEAEPLMRRALEISKASFGEHHPTVAIGLNNLAQLLTGHQPDGGSGTADAASAGDRRGLLRRAPPDRGDSI